MAPRHFALGEQRGQRQASQSCAEDNQFRMSILERLEQMERRMAEMTGSQQHKQGSGGGSSGGGAGSGNGGSQAQCASSPGTLGSCFESRVVVVCEKMMSRACWAKSKHLIHSKTFRGMTLLHLAAAQGYATLIQTLIKWRTKHADSIDLELEVDPLNVDHFSCTPLMWACALGHLEAAVVLYKWDRRAISIPDSLGRLPLGIARSRGHVKLAECLEHLQRDEQAQLGQNPRIHCPPSEEPGTESWMTQWHSEAISSPEIPKGVTVIASTNPELRRPRSEPSNYYSSESHKDYPAPKKHKLNPEYFQARQEKLLSTALSLEQPNIRKQSPSSKQCVPETISPSEGVRGYSPDTSPPAPETAGFQASGSQPVVKWNSKDLYIGVSTVQVTGNPKGTSVGKETALSQVRPREPMSVLMMANREVVNTELGSFRDSAESEECSQSMDDIQVNMMTLAEHIIEATPDRIKQENFVPMESPALERTDAATISSTMSWLAGYLADVDHLPNAAQISLSPVGSPVSEIAFEKPSLPSAADWSEFLSASSSEKVENEFAQLTLSDHEQRELYEAARLVQTAFRKYKGRPLREQQEVAAAVIQRCYRKYKQYALYKKMTQAAILIQSKFRSYYEQKKFQQSRRAAVLIQKYYRSYKKCGKRRQARRTAVIVQQKLRSASAPAGSSAASGSNRRLQQTQNQVDECDHIHQVVDIMRVNVDKVLERDQKLSELDDRADALQAGASQFETSAAKLKRKYWWKNCKMWAIGIAIVVIIVIIIIVELKPGCAGSLPAPSGFSRLILVLSLTCPEAEPCCLVWWRRLILVMKNGDYLILDSSWSSLVSPWGQEVSVIIASVNFAPGPRGCFQWLREPGEQRVPGAPVSAASSMRPGGRAEVPGKRAGFCAPAVFRVCRCWFHPPTRVASQYLVLT
ncbi:hypothetical protein CB1_029410002 [Camelus ferus]|nr:hypothetical protein CB1_029410002 [Camelus ferus]